EAGLAAAAVVLVHTDRGPSARVPDAEFETRTTDPGKRMRRGNGDRQAYRRGGGAGHRLRATRRPDLDTVVPELRSQGAWGDAAYERSTCTVGAQVDRHVAVDDQVGSQ